MKKNIFAVIMLSLLTIFCFTACNSQSSVIGNFDKKEYIVSIGDSIDFSQSLNVSGVEKNKISFVSSNENIIKKEDNSNFKAVESGEAYVFANYNDNTIASVKVRVKYNQITPKGFILEENGFYTWEKSFTVVDGNEVYATQYEIGYCLIDDTTDFSRIEYVYKIIDDNYFIFEEKGSYFVKVRALGDNITTDDSEFSQEEIINVGVVGILENIDFTYSYDFGTPEVVMSWDKQQNVQYDVYIDGIKIYENIIDNFITINYQIYSIDKYVTIKIVSKDLTNQLMSSSTIVYLQKLDYPDLTYNLKNNNGFLSFNEIQNASGYCFEIVDNQTIGQKEIIEYSADAFENSYILEGKEYGVYFVSVISKGGKNLDNIYYLNSEVKEQLLVAKLQIPSVEVSFKNKEVRFSFKENDYVENYRITWADESIIFNTQDGLEKTIDLNGLDVGKYTFRITALPTVVDGKVQQIEINGNKTSNVLNSDDYVLDFYVLDELNYVEHSYDSYSNISIIKVDKIDNANSYLVYVNDELVNTNNYEVKDENTYIEIRLNNLKGYQSFGDKYFIKIVAYRINEQNIECSTKIEIVKELDILSIVSDISEEQINGSFKWNILDNDMTYYEYKIYKTDKNFIKDESSEAIITGNTKANQIKETLEFGYYVIEIASKSENTNLYLDSNFNNIQNVYSKNIIVTKDLETPSVVFDNNLGQNRLIINTVEFGGGYSIYVDGKYDGGVILGAGDLPEYVEYTFEEGFELAKDYNISIIATSGTSFDGNIHLNSDPYKLVITKLATPTFNISEVFDEFDNDKKIHEYLEVQMIDNAVYPVIKLNGEIINKSNEKIIDMIDYSIFDTEFEMTIMYVATTNKDDHYYLNSELKEINFQRVSAPSAIGYSDGIITFNSVDSSKIENYYVTITIVNSQNGNYYNRFFTEDNSLSFNLQEKINDLLQNNQDFKNAYRMLDYIQVELFSHKIGEIGNIYYLPSDNGTTLLGKNKLDIYKLDAPTIAFDSESMILSWNNVSENTSYDIYVDDVLKIENYSATSLNLNDINDIDWLVAKNVYVKSNNKQYLDSNNSNVISIKKLQTITNINIAKDGEDWVVSIPILSNTANIKEVQVNGSVDNVDYSQGGNIAKIKIKDFLGVNEFNVQLIYKNLNETNYFINSNISTFTLYNLSDCNFDVSLQDDTIVWNNVVKDLSGADINPVEYTIKIINDKDYYIVTKELSCSIQDIENKISAKLNDNVEIIITANIAENYSLSSQNGNAIGYFGEKASSSLNLFKLNQISDTTVEIFDDTTKATILDQKLNAYTVIKWHDEWSTFENIKFKITINYENDEKVELLLKNGDNHDDYKLILDSLDQTYQLTLFKNVIKSGLNKIDIQVINTGNISSEVKSIDIERLKSVEDIAISDSGVLTITDNQNQSFLIQITTEDQIIEKLLIVDQENFSKEINLMTNEYLSGKIGAYIVKIVAFDNSFQKLPSSLEVVIKGYKLEGIDNVSVDNNGNIVLTLIVDDFNDLVFSVRYKKGSDYIIKSFTPFKEDTSNQFKIAMIDLIKLYNDVLTLQGQTLSFDFTVRKSGSVDADWINLTFDYCIDSEPSLKRESNLTQDYIIFSKNDNTISFRVLIQTQEDSYVKYFTADDCLGYWKTNSDNSIIEFTKDKGTEVGFTYTECFGVSVNEIIGEIQFGQVNFLISRIGKNDDVFEQYSEYAFEVYKLAPISNQEQDSIIIEDNVLYWQWNQIDVNEQYLNVQPTGFYVVFENTIDQTKIQIISYKKALNLLDVMLDGGDNYNISIIAFSSQSNIISSDISNSVSTTKYTQPIGIAVKDGKLVFNEKQFLETSFMQTIIDHYNKPKGSDTKIYDLLNQVWKDPIYFSIGEFGTNVTNLVLKFTLKKDGALTNTSYEIVVNASQLFPDIQISVHLDYSAQKKSYIDLLVQDYQSISGEENNAIKNFKTFVTTLVSTNKGIGDNSILLDDIARQIPAGDYAVSVKQTGIGVFLDSESSVSCKVYVTAAPEISLQNEKIQEKSQYTVNILPVSTYYVKNWGNDGEPNLLSIVTAQSYKMVFRYTTSNKEEKIIEFIIQYSGNQWDISYNNEKIEPSDENIPILSNIESSFDIPGFKLNLTSLRKSCDDKNLIPINTLINVDIFAYLVSNKSQESNHEQNDYVVNGKSAIFSINYLDLIQENIKFENGQFIIEAGLDNTFEVLVRYVKEGLAPDSMTTNFSDGVAKINLQDSGLYEYLILSINGSISYNLMNIESDTYAVLEVYKLDEPILKVVNNNIQVTFSSISVTYMPTLKFNMGNNISLSDGYDKGDEGYYYQNDFTKDSNGVSYIIGSKDEEGNIIYPSELTASQFQAYLNGNSGGFEESDETFSTQTQSADHLLNFVGSSRYPVLSSDVTYLKAKMISKISLINAVGGDISWTALEDLDFVDADGNKGELIYEVSVLYYVLDVDGETFVKQGYEDVYYTKSNTLSSNYISEKYSYYRIIVNALAGVASDENNSSAKHTVEGEYYIFEKTVYYNSEDTNKTAVLRSQETILYGTEKGYLVRTESPFLTENQTGIYEGKINLIKKKKLYEDTGSSEDINNRISIFAEYERLSKIYTIKLTGSFSFTDDSAQGNKDYKFVTFTLDQGQLNNIGEFDIKIYIYCEGKINSKPLCISSINKLTKVSEAYYEIKLNEDGKTYIDFSKYFTAISINNDYYCYQIKVSIENFEGVEENVKYLSKNGEQIFVLDTSMVGKVLSIQVIDAQDSTQSNPKLLLNSDIVKINIYNTDASDLSVSWNENDAKFEWKWKSENSGRYQFWVSMLIDGIKEPDTVSGSEGDDAYTYNYFYMPRRSGEVSMFMIRVRLIDDTMQNIYLFSDAINLNEVITFNVFDGGDGTKNNPYLINNSQDFLNISKRNLEGQTFYFKLTSDIVIKNSDLYVSQLDEETGAEIYIHLMETFYGILDGNNHKITIETNSIYDMDAYSTNVSGMGSVSFNKFASIFKKIDKTATIKNLIISYKLSFNKLSNNNILFAPLALYNYGNIDNVSLTEFNLENINGNGYGNNVIISSIVSINYGQIMNSKNTVDFTYTMAQRLVLKVAYAGICAFNTSNGSIVGCFNSGNKIFTGTVTNNIVISSGISIINLGKISACGNDGNFVINTSGSAEVTAYFVGITLSNDNGTLEYVYNNGSFTKNSSFATLRSSGISYNLLGGTINNIVDTSNIKCFSSYSSIPTIKGSVYSNIGSGIVNITTKALTEMQINCGSTGYKLVVSLVSGTTYKAAITK